MRPAKPLQSSPTLLVLSGHDVLPTSGPGVVDSTDATTATSRKTTRQHVLLDTRTFQDLEPLRLPSKLRERITKAQRRAAAEKDGVSIFTANATTSLLSSLHQGDDKEPPLATGSSSASSSASTSVAAGGKSSSSLSKKTRRRESQSPSQPQLLAVAATTVPPPASGLGVLLKPKMHLPDVILGHKMREFEAKMSVNALFVDPLEKNLHHLTIDEKEKVMLKMQDKIQQITAQVDDHFVQLKEQLDANGIFDSAANYQRAQALCLVELQKKCKLEKIRDDAMIEVLGDDRTGSGDDASRARGGALSQMEDKLNELLAQKQRDADHELACTETTRLEAARVLAMSHLQRTTKSSALKRRPGIVAPPPATPVAGMGNKTTRGSMLLSPVKRLQLQQNKNGNKHGSNQIDHERREDVVGIVEKGDTSTTTTAVSGSPTESDWASRHPHIAHVLANLHATGDASHSTATTTTTGAASAVDSLDSFSSRGIAGDSGGGPLDDTPSATSGAEWAERSTSYQTIATRVNQELLQRCARWRWDATSHFHSEPPLQRETHTLSASLLQRLHYRQRNTASARLREEDERLRQLQRDETNGDKRKKADALYQQLQETIQSKRLKADLRRFGSATGRAATRASTAGSRGHAGGLVTGDATRRAATSEGTTRRQLKQQTVELPPAQQTLLASASAPALGSQTTANELLDPGATHSLHPAESRRSLLDRKLVVAPGLLGQTRSGSRHHSRLRGGSRIGAPSFTDLTTLGHHSNTRMEERRSSAQTWAWHQPSGQLVASNSSPGATAAAAANAASRHYRHGDISDDDYDSDVDASERRDAMGVVDEEDHDNDDDEEEEGDNDNENDDSGAETDDDDDDGEDDDDARSLRSSVSSVRSSFSVVAKAKKLALKKQSPSKKRSGHASSHNHRHRQSPKASSRRGISSVRGPRGSHLNARTSFSSSASGASGSGGGMFANIQFTANAQVLQNRLEEIWRVLEFPFSTKLLMLEKYADLSDSDALAQALTQWETAVDMVVVREKLKHVLAEYEELQEIKESSRLAPADWSYLHMQQLEIPVNAINLATETFVQWIREHMDAITQRCEKMAQQLKAKTGDELTFQGRRYPQRM